MSEKKKKSLSFSEYQCYLQCPHKWYLNYYLRVPSETNEELIFGSVLHASIEQLLSSKLDKKLFIAMPESTSRDIFKSCLKKELSAVKDINFLNKFNERNLGKIFMFQASHLITKLNFFTRFKDYEVVDIEFKLDDMLIISNDEVDITYKGYIDLVLRNVYTGKYLILDWKTSSKPWDIKQKLKDNEDFFAQLCLYKHYYAEKKCISLKNIDTKFYNLPKTEPQNQSPYEGILTEEYMESFLEGFKNTAIKIYAHSQSLTEFKKQKFITKKNYCHRCSYNTPELCDDMNEFQKPNLFKDKPINGLSENIQ